MTKDNLTAEQQQQLKELGGNLHRIRVAKNISLETIAANTHISQRLLAAIEAGDTAELPEPFYIQALVSKFARQIGAEEVKFEIEHHSSETVVERSLPLSNRQGWRGFQLRTFHLYLIYILLVVASVKAITSVVERPAIVDRTPVERPIADPPANREQPPAIAVEPPRIPQLVSQSSNTESVSVGINLQERCWLKVMVDGQVAFEGVLPQGTQRQWTGRKQVTIRAGNAGGVAITFNNQQQKILGAPGQVEEVTYTVN